MLLIHKFALALIALVFASSGTAAHAAEWNRRISDVRIVHPPGTPPGLYRAEVDVEVGANGTPLGPISFDCSLEMNGTILEVVTVVVEPSNTPNICPGSCIGGCNIWQNAFSVPLPGNCNAVGGCQCSYGLSVDFVPFGATHGSLLLARVTPTTGSLPEIDTSDDFFNLVVPEHNPGTPSCAGDGSGAACPCANGGASGHGCANSSNPLGAQLTATGFTETSSITGTDSVVLHGSGMPATSPVLYIQVNSGSTPIPFGDGILCVGGSLIRLRTKINVGGASQFPALGDPSISSVGGAVSGSGTTYSYQAYYRDTGSFCSSATFNLTNGVSVTW